MSGLFGNELTWIDRELKRVRQSIAYADTCALSAEQSDKERSGALRGQVYVWLAAALERTVSDAVRTTLRAINAQVVKKADVRPSLFSLLCEPELKSISDRNRQSGLEVRVALFSNVIDPAIADFNEAVVPLDGRTLRPEHFDTMWRVFGLGGGSLPGPLHRVALTDLANGRNEVAHGHQDPVTFGKAKATSDLNKLTDRVDDIVVHLVTALDEYLSKKQYCR